MECMQAKALKTSLQGELTQHELIEEFYFTTTTNTTTTTTTTGISCVSGEDLFVDELLNLQNVEFEDGYVEEEDDDEEEKHSFSLEDENSNVSGDSESHLTSELAVPDDDLAGLEWVSHFVDDSLSDFSLLHPLGKQRTEPNRSEPEPRRTGKTPLCFPTIPVRPRTKRVRPTPRPSSLSQLTESSQSSSSTTPSLILALSKAMGEPGRKKQKRKPAVQAGSGSTGSSSTGAVVQRRCSHCQVQKTPQWRAGPLGAKTLCNACGVRFKSGRLFPEYRPACSPTFSGDVHSNSHRKVLELRKKKEIVGPGSGLNQVISSF
ncbi:hypothetical protein TIFTF001_024889 [Ficus carica]|uniref:GATA transcription factor n=1 Tax=Ficus carica TaxID=3494 RepID=A0AA88AHQ5_FICCA|nr:hypothetical protein TIFTF001_024889 [Ficus carica]